MLFGAQKKAAALATELVVASLTAYRQVRDFFGARKKAPFRG